MPTMIGAVPVVWRLSELGGLARVFHVWAQTNILSISIGHFNWKIAYGCFKWKIIELVSDFPAHIGLPEEGPILLVTPLV